ncbi:hypothetical protein [Kocuria oceani]|uniref:Uncharacterized protein n=1 Tax=Kocuria oceani TaxID=988827 RepID=A0ABV9TNS6_9MICC|nr:hypothetical protein [Kocuria oceani]
MKTIRLPVLALGAVLALAAPAAASATPAPAPTSSVGTSTPAESADQQARDRLNELATTQTQAQIQEILDSDQPAEVLYDVEAEKYLAAYTTGPAVPELSLDPFTAPRE